MIARSPARLLADTSGATIVEFAMVAPVLLMTMMGLFDLGHNMYTSQMLHGAIQKAARDSTIEGAASSTAHLDGIVTNAVKVIAPGSTLTFSRKAYSNFTSVSRPENYDDVNANNTCDAGEAFEDANKNGTWDSDTGSAGFGSARDAVLYTVTVTYPRTFPLAAFIPGQSKTMTMTAINVLRNQPYGMSKGGGAAGAGNCT
ncbi:MAG: TadE/TadG family type IV pilus assembly protein [Novosphingobium sp.]|uniref:TadE/TadG family type IV pilus assembly protein n=1 Tax=Novosphingobium sp. TaxID=1874826 RepID=UPI0032B8CCB5